jgi:DNA-binding transcriptional LysR family regulator
LHPNVNFTITQLPESDTEYDILISDIFPREHSKKFLLFDEEILVAMNKNSHLTQKKNLTVSDLENERFIALSTSESLKNITVNVCREAGFSPVFSIQTHSTSFMRRYISMGLGVAFTPSSWNTDQSSDIVYRKIDNLRRKTYAFLPRQTYVKRSALDFLKMLIEETGNTGFDIEAK